MKYLDIFNDIIDIIHNDYSGCKDKAGIGNHEKFLEIIKKSDHMTDYDFMCLVREYLLAFRDGHLGLFSNNNMDFTNGFVARRYEDRLYVESAELESGFQLGDAILKIDGKTIPDLESIYGQYMQDQPWERQTWKEVIKKGSVCTVISKTGEIKNVQLLHLNIKSKPSIYEYKNLSDKVCIITLSDFINERGILNLINKHREEIESKDVMIIDVRNNSGGSDSAYFPLLKYIFKDNCTLNELLQGEDIYVNYSKRNCEGRIAIMDEMVKKGVDEETVKLIEYMKREINKNMGKGFIKEDDNEFDFEIKGQDRPLKVYILSDKYCGSSGDSFVYLCKKSKKVTVVGRNTKGLTDYSNCTLSVLGDFSLCYPTSRDSAIDKGKGIGGIGVAVDKYIPWTPEAIEEDIDLKYVMDEIKQK